MISPFSALNVFQDMFWRLDTSISLLPFGPEYPLHRNGTNYHCCVYYLKILIHLEILASCFFLVFYCGNFVPRLTFAFAPQLTLGLAET